MDDEKKDTTEMSDELKKVELEGETEAPFTGRYVNHKAVGDYMCALCDIKLFSSDAKFDSGTGWPSFSEPDNLEHVELKEDLSQGMKRTEVTCKNCGAHLGHVFDDGPRDRGGKRYCINSVCLNFVTGEKVTDSL